MVLLIFCAFYIILCIMCFYAHLELRNSVCESGSNSAWLKSCSVHEVVLWSESLVMSGDLGIQAREISYKTNRFQVIILTVLNATRETSIPRSTTSKSFWLISDV